MSIKVINLNKLLRICASSERSARSFLRDDVRQERDKLLGKKSGGGHYQHPWWNVAKQHAVGAADLLVETPLLCAADKTGRRNRLYPRYTERFVDWLDRAKRTTNREFQWTDEEVHTHYAVPGYDLIVKVDNLLALKIGDDRHKLVYPYFAERPILSRYWARIGLWLMGDALSSHDRSDMEILDVLRGVSFSGASIFPQGNEQTHFNARYEKLLDEWFSLRREFGLP